MLSYYIFFFLFCLLIPNKIKKILCSKSAFFAVRRSQRDQMGMITRTMERLPPELLSNILSRLPARHLLKCKLVCKSWFDLIADPLFISKYYFDYNNLFRSQTQHDHLLVIRT